MWDTLDLLPPDAVPKSYQDKVKATPQCDSFMHLHLGFDAEVVAICFVLTNLSLYPCLFPYWLDYSFLTVTTQFTGTEC